jgi:hypothetical protein
MENPVPAPRSAEAESYLDAHGRWVNRVEEGLAQLPGVAIMATEALKDLRDFRIETTANFRAVDAKFKAIDVRLDKMDARFDKMDARLDGMDDRLGKVEERLGGVEGRLGNVESLLVKIANKLDVSTVDPSLN